MKINFSKKEYRLLMDMVEISEWVLNAHYDEDRKETKQYTELAQKILSHAKEMGYQNLITYDQEFKQYFATRDYEENGDHMKFIDEFEEDVFWDSLSHRLAMRDLVQQEGEEKVLKMEFLERGTKLMDLESWYQDELAENGLLHLKIDKHKSGKEN